MAKPNPDNLIHPDAGTTNAFNAYYHVPPVWIEENPYKDNQEPSKETIHKEISIRKFSNGIKVIVCRDGLFIFDFSGWGPGQPMQVPAIVQIKGETIPKSHEEAFEEMCRRVYRRVEVMNAHLTCLTTSLSKCENRTEPISQVISPDDYLVAYHITTGGWGFQLDSHRKQTHAYFAEHWGASSQDQNYRPCIRLQTVQHSFDLLDQLMSFRDPDFLTIASLLLRSSKFYGEHDFSGSVILSWTVLERLISDLWEKLLDDNRESPDDQTGQVFINAKRREKLIDGRDYSASVRTEILSLMRKIDLQMYKDLNEIRGTRNDWLHDLTAVDSNAASLALVTSQRLFKQVSGIELVVPISLQMSI